jgi:hypothetical protein
MMKLEGAYTIGVFYGLAAFAIASIFGAWWVYALVAIGLLGGWFMMLAFDKGSEREKK